jgi:hypothetical protein
MGIFDIDRSVTGVVSLTLAAQLQNADMRDETILTYKPKPKLLCNG